MNDKKHHSIIPTPGMKRIQNYIFKFQDLLGKGNFSSVYKGVNQMTNLVVAVKYISLNILTCERLKQLLDQQIQIFTSLNHPNIVKCYEVLKSVNNCYIITELCNGGDLGELLAKKRVFTQDQASSYIKDIFQGLYYLSKKNIVHRDIKIANIFINNGKAKLADFGFAQRSKTQFYDGSIGTPLCMSPEGFLDNLYGCKTDVWAFGVILYQLTHGKLHLQNCTSEQMLKKQIGIQLKKQQLKRQLSEDLKQLIIQCLDVNPFTRITFQEIRNSAYIKRITNEQISPISLQQIKFIPSLHLQHHQEDLVSLKGFDHPHFNHLQSHQKNIVHKQNNIKDFYYGKNTTCQVKVQKEQKCICKPAINIFLNQQNNNLLAEKRVYIPSLNIQQKTQQFPMNSYQSPKSNKFSYADDKQNSNVSTTDMDFLQVPCFPSQLPFRKHKGSFDLSKNQQINQDLKKTLRTTISAKMSYDNENCLKISSDQNKYVRKIKNLPIDYNPITNTKRILNGFLKYNEAIGLIHYCRLLYKYIAELKSTGIYHVGDLNLKYYSNFLLNILNELLQKIVTKQIILSLKQHSNQQIDQKFQKMRNVLNEYIERYKPNIEKERAEYLNRNTGQIKHIVNLDKNFIEAFTIVNKEKITKYNKVLSKFTELLQNSSRYQKYIDFDSNDELQNVFLQLKCQSKEQGLNLQLKLTKKNSINMILA